jgi:hypothetical protein
MSTVVQDQQNRAVAARFRIGFRIVPISVQQAANTHPDQLSLESAPAAGHRAGIFNRSCRINGFSAEVMPLQRYSLPMGLAPRISARAAW